MAQFRLTQKFATDMKVSSLSEPCLVTPICDDWFVDVVRVQRKKVAIATHGKSLLTFLLPYEQIGGAKSVPSCVGISLGIFLTENELSVAQNQVEEVFSMPPTFCKTNDRKVIGHMTDFKNCIDVMDFYRNVSFSKIDWDEIMNDINHTPIVTRSSPMGTRKYSNVTETAKELFSNHCLD